MTFRSRRSSRSRRPSSLAGGGSAASSGFLIRVYLYLFAAIFALVALEAWLFASGLAQRLAASLRDVPWMLILGLFLLVGWFASRLAHRTRSVALQILALGTYVAAQALFLVPLLVGTLARLPGAVESAAFITLAAFGALTALVFVTKWDFSLLGGLVRWGFLLALVAIVAALIFGFRLGILFSVAMVGLAGASILLDTSRIRRRSFSGRPIAAALELFASVAVLFWYVLRLQRRSG